MNTLFCTAFARHTHIKLADGALSRCCKYPSRKKGPDMRLRRVTGPRGGPPDRTCTQQKPTPFGIKKDTFNNERNLTVSYELLVLITERTPGGGLSSGVLLKAHDLVNG